MKKIRKILRVIQRIFIKTLAYLNVDLYMKKYFYFLKEEGVNFTGKNNFPKFIDRSVYFDGTDYSLIYLGDNITISREVMFLTHDYSINTALCSIGKKINRNEGEFHFRNEIHIGDNCFIGARASILPNTQIGNNCIVGSCCVVKGNIPDDSIIIGNPCKIIGSTKKYAEKHMVAKDYFIEK